MNAQRHPERTLGTGRLAPALLGLLILALSAAVARPAAASHYRLADLGLFSDAELAGLNGLNLQTTDQLLARVAGPTERAALHKALGGKASVERVREWASWCDLLQVTGIGPTMVRLLRRGGVAGSADLATRDSAVLAKALDEINAREKIAGKTPAAEHLLGWIASAKTAPVKIR